MTTTRHGDPRFYALLDEIAELHSNKNHDYAKTDEPLSNFTRSKAFGVEPWRGVLIRMSDKWSRLEQLANGKQPKNESMRDTLIDLAVYALIDVLLLEQQQPATGGLVKGPVPPMLEHPCCTKALSVQDSRQFISNEQAEPNVGRIEPKGVGQLGYVIPEEAKIRA